MSTELSTAPEGPIADSSRILGIDVARGFALLGILFVNAAFFAMPFGELYTGSKPVSEGWASRVVYWFVGVFCTGKFYPLFSILFGAGLAIIYDSTRQSGRSFGWIYFRRLVVLAMFGIAHIVLLWYGDILLLYAGVGTAMLLLGRASPKVLLWVAAITFSISLITSLGFSALSAFGNAGSLAEEIEFDMAGEEIESTARPMPEGSSPIEKLGKVLMDWDGSEQFDSRVTELELEIQSKGPYSNAILLRLFLYAFSLVYYLSITIWVVLPCFCIGAVLTKTGFFRSPENPWRRRLIVLGFAIGLPISVIADYAYSYSDEFLWSAIYMLGTNIAGPLLALAYLSAILVLVERSPQNPIAVAIGNLGKMGLTGYLLESTLMSALMSHWGLAWFGTTTWIQRAGIVIAVYLVILLFANLWMRSFRYGPFEWLWRSLTYLQRQPIRKADAMR